MNISVKIGKAKFQNPVTVASGTFGHTEKYGQSELITNPSNFPIGVVAATEQFLSDPFLYSPVVKGVASWSANCPTDIHHPWQRGALRLALEYQSHRDE